MGLNILVLCSNITGFQEELWELISVHSQFPVKKRATVSNVWQDYVLLVESLQISKVQALRN